MIEQTQGLTPAIKVTLASLTMNSHRELTDLKSIVLGHEAFSDIRFIFNKTDTNLPITATSSGSDKLNCCRWHLFKNTPTITVCHPKALQIGHDIRKAFEDLGVSSKVIPLHGQYQIGWEHQTQVSIRQPMLLKHHDKKIWNELKTTQEKVKLVNKKLQAAWHEELTTHGASAELLSETKNIRLAGNSEQMDAMMSLDNEWMHNTASSAAKARVGNKGGLRWGFKSLTISLPFQIRSHALSVGYFKNIGFGKVMMKQGSAK
ncbi:hypothetical protein ACP3V3_02610 [Vibrio sp. PNB22_3_1]